MKIKATSRVIKSEMIREWMSKEGISHEWLSQLLGRSKSYVSYCLQAGTMNEECVKKLAQLMGETEYSITTTLEERYRYYHPEVFQMIADDARAEALAIDAVKPTVEYIEEPIVAEKVMNEPVSATVIIEDKSPALPWAELNMWLASYIARGQFSVPVSDVLNKLSELQARNS